MKTIFLYGIGGPVDHYELFDTRRSTRKTGLF